VGLLVLDRGAIDFRPWVYSILDRGAIQLRQQTCLTNLFTLVEHLFVFEGVDLLLSLTVRAYTWLCISWNSWAAGNWADRSWFCWLLGRKVVFLFSTAGLFRSVIVGPLDELHFSFAVNPR